MLWFPVIFLMGSPHDVKSVLLMLISYLYFDCRGRLHISKYDQWFIDPLPSSFSKTILTYRRVCFKPQCNIHFVCFSSGFPVQNIWWTVNSYTASFRFLNNWRPRQITSMLVCMYGSWYPPLNYPRSDNVFNSCGQASVSWMIEIQSVINVVRDLERVQIIIHLPEHL